MSLRSDFADALRVSLPGDRVIDHAYELDGLDAHIPVIMLERTQVERAPNGIGGYFVRFNVHAISPISGRDTADDALDDLADRVLEALDSYAYALWDTMTRAVYLEKYPSWVTTVTVYGDRSEGLS